MHVAILGAGISGLSLAYFLQKNSPGVNVSLFEQSAKSGGAMESIQESGFFFERGPHTFLVSKSADLLKLIDEVGLRKDLISSNKKAKRRYLFLEKKLVKLPKNPWEFFFSKSGKKLLWPLLLEPFQPISSKEDESIYDFARRRLGKFAAENLFNAIQTGIYAGDIRKLSIGSCFPLLKKREELYGSLVKGFLAVAFQKKKRDDSFGFRSNDLITLQNGIQSLTHALEDKVKLKWNFNTKIEKILEEEHFVQLVTAKKTFSFDFVFCALPIAEVNRLFPNLLSIPTVDLVTVNLGFRQKINYPKGFGYLVPLSKEEKILGMIFDSAIFPKQNQTANETRFTVMLGGAFHPEIVDMAEKECIELSLLALKKHLSIDCSPQVALVKKHRGAIPQYEVGHRQKVREFEKLIQKKHSRISFLGNYLHGVSLSDCVSQAKRCAARWITTESV